MHHGRDACALRRFGDQVLDDRLRQRLAVGLPQHQLAAQMATIQRQKENQLAADDRATARECRGGAA
jgi:hypothetical protein